MQLFQRSGHWLNRLSVSLLDVLYPSVCCACEHPLVEGVPHICADCWNGITRIDPSHPAWRELHDRLCIQGAVTDIASCFLFEKDGALQKLLHALKYDGMTSVGRLLGREVGRAILADRDRTAIAALVPVPLHPLKFRERGYNQSAYVCLGIRDVTGIPVYPSLLKRKRYTDSQTRLDLEERRANVAGVFAIGSRRKASLAGRGVMIVDDVMTTGATIGECARKLDAIGVRPIVAVSVAIAQ